MASYGSLYRNLWKYIGRALLLHCWSFSARQLCDWAIVWMAHCDTMTMYKEQDVTIVWMFCEPGCATLDSRKSGRASNSFAHQWSAPSNSLISKPVGQIICCAVTVISALNSIPRQRTVVTSRWWQWQWLAYNCLSWDCGYYDIVFHTLELWLWLRHWSPNPTDMMRLYLIVAMTAVTPPMG